MFDKILIANRGEIAVRVIRTAQRLGIQTVAVFSDADEAALHVAMADQAVRIGPAPVPESYLRSEAILAAAARTGAQAIHPGYGFLAENADFARAVADAGLTFIGPPAEAIDAMGQKAQAKALMTAAGVPVVPGYHDRDQDPDLLAAEADRIGFPVLIKAVAGGGGKGMRRVDDPGKFAAALKGARREALSAFGDDQVLLERYLTKPRHIEVQVFADAHGNAVHLFERDCSIQRRHQKVIEEAPAPGMTAAMRQAMGDAAVAAAKAIGYRGAGTVEFIAEVASGLSADQFFFMEMNTRLQVEHPVTEMITGFDLVEWQLRVAAGEPLPVGQDEIAINGHAMEARIYAEMPWKKFLPSTGTLTRLRPPPAATDMRIDTGVREGDAVTIYYDPMIAKLIAWGADRQAATLRLRQGLGAYQITGVGNNVTFLDRVCGHPAFADGDVHTGFIDSHAEALLREADDTTRDALIVAALTHITGRDAARRTQQRATADPHSPWAALGAWRMNHQGAETVTFAVGDDSHDVGVVRDGAGRFTVSVNGTVLPVRHFGLDDGAIGVEIDGLRASVPVSVQGDAYEVLMPSGSVRLTHVDPIQFDDIEDEGTGSVVAPLPGKVVQVLAAAGQSVKRGDALLILEAMKMEHTIAAPADAVIAEIAFAEGQQVDEGALLVAFESGGDE